MRLYTFCNYYLSSIQQGIQTAHVVSELMYKHCSENQFKMIQDWAKYHKTIVVCNGGNSKDIEDLHTFFCNKENPYPLADFAEDEQSLNSALTCVGIILPEEIYEVKSEFKYGYSSDSRERTKIYGYYPEDLTKMQIYSDPSDYTYKLIDKIKSAPLAR
jgi:hypothetical protein